MACPIAWCGFSWEAFATLATGLAAVTGAYRLGGRQIKILHRQTTLQESQFKIGIFERRMDIFRAVEQLIFGVVGVGGPASDEIEQDFLIAKQEARFLFSKDISEFLTEIWKNYVQLKVYHDAMKESFEESGQYGKDNVEKKHSALKWISDCSDNLADRFAAINPIIGDKSASPRFA